MELFIILESSELASQLRDSVWAYPLCSAGHIMGIGLLFGSVVVADIRLLGLGRHLPLTPLVGWLSRTAIAGLAIAITFGCLLFITRATEYVASPYFIAKMTLLFIALLNACFLMHQLRQASAENVRSDSVPLSVKPSALLSIFLWSAVLILGRLIGYF